MNQRPVLPPAFQQLTLNKQRHPVANVGDHQFADRRAVGTFGYVHVGRPSRDQPGGRRGARPDREHRQWPKPRTTPHVQFRHLHRHTGTMPLTQVSKAPPARPLPGAVQGVAGTARICARRYLDDMSAVTDASVAGCSS